MLDRDVKILGVLQQRSSSSFTSKFATNVFLPEKVFVLCVHKASLPFLESYECEIDVDSHMPQTVQDLFNCAFVTRTVEDERTFIIGFENSTCPSLEFAALSSFDCSEWVRILNEELPKLNCLPEHNNVYVTLPISVIPATSYDTNPQVYISERPSYLQDISIENSLFEPLYESIASCSLSESVSQQSERLTNVRPQTPNDNVIDISDCPSTVHTPSMISNCVAPALPPRKCKNSSIQNDANVNCSSVYDFLNPEPIYSEAFSAAVEDFNEHSNNLPSNRSSDRINTVQVKNFNHDDPGSIVELCSAKVIETINEQVSSPVFGRYSEVGIIRPVPNHLKSTFRSPTLSSTAVYEDISQGTSVLAPHLQRTTVSWKGRRHTATAQQNSIDLVIPVTNTLKKLSVRERETLKLQRDIESRNILRIIVNAEAAVRGLAIVELSNAVWIAGWSVVYNKVLSCAFHVGDKILSIAGRCVPTKFEEDKKFLDSLAFTGTIEFDILRLPCAKAIAIRKNLDTDDLGITRMKSKNEIIDVALGGLAANAGLSARAVSYLDGDSFVNWFITEINGRPINLFAENNEAGERLSALGLDITLVVQPVDFIKLLKKSLKQQKKRFKDYVIGC